MTAQIYHSLQEYHLYQQRSQMTSLLYQWQTLMRWRSAQTRM